MTPRHIRRAAEIHSDSAGVGARHLDQIVETVIDVRRHQPARVRHGGTVVMRVVAIGRGARQRRRHLDQPVERVEGLPRHIR